MYINKAHAIFIESLTTLRFGKGLNSHIINMFHTFSGPNSRLPRCLLTIYVGILGRPQNPARHRSLFIDDVQIKFSNAEAALEIGGRGCPPGKDSRQQH